MRNQKNGAGFSLLELIVVVAIVLILAAIAIPNLQRSKMSANEASAVASLRTLNAACIAYTATWGNGFPVSLANLGPGKPATSTKADLIDSLLAGGKRSGYKFTYVSGAPQSGKISSYTVNGNPSLAGMTGVRYFFTDSSGVIRYNYGSQASASSKPI
ncbi:MAG: type II secretion system protein [Candidatus Acidiferrum sp.]